METALPIAYLARHGETAWSLTGQHTGRTDLPLTEHGEKNARRLGERLQQLAFARVYVSPLQRARRTCELALGELAATKANVDPDLVEWDYGQYEGRRSVEIRAQQTDWQLFRDGCPGGESPADVALRSDRVIAKVRATQENVLLFSSGHLLRVLVARWLGLDVSGGRYFALDTASLSALGYDRDLSRPVVRLWNDTSHVGE